MKCTVISDTHGKHYELDLSKYPADTLIHSGDWTGGRDIKLFETTQFLQWMSEQPYKHKICIAGNHELQVEMAGYSEIHELCAKYGVTYLQDTSITIEGVKFYGAPYSNQFGNWAFMGEDSELSDIWDQIPSDTHVLITHGPAYQTLDKVSKAYGRDPHVGSASLAMKKQSLSTLKYHISGHIHEAYGTVEQHGIMNICASILDDKYRHVNKPIQFDIKANHD